MYKCTDCGKEYKEKPQFCDCGNITFEEIKDKEEVRKINPAQKSIKNNVKNTLPEQKQKPDIISLFIFIICIILSILSLIFIGQDTQKNNNINTQTKEQTVNKEIPPIEKLWAEKQNIIENKQPSIQEQKPKQEEKIQKPNIKPKQIFSLPSKTKDKQKTSQPKQVKQNQSRPNTNTNQLQQKKQTPALQSQQNQTANTQTQTKVQKQIPPNINLPVPSGTQITAAKNEPAKVNSESLKKELVNYKVRLRNKITTDINFSKIIGDGNCIVTFKIDANGNLINRKFLKQSENDSLNNQVYNAIMKNPIYNPPPEGYKNETLKYSVKIYGQSFEIDLS